MALIVVGLLLAPVAAVAAWARIQLTDTDRFVDTFAPIADDPAVQALLTQRVSGAIGEQLNVDGLVDDVVDGLQQLGLPPRADDALDLLRAPASQGVESLVERVVGQVVRSEDFAAVWQQSLRATHQRSVSTIQGDPDTLVDLADDGTVSIRLGPVIAAVRAELDDRGIRLADALPDTDRAVTVLQSDALVAVRTLYSIAVGVGAWLPWLVAALLVAGVLAARRRLRALMWASAGLAGAFALLGIAVGGGRSAFIAQLGPDPVSAAAAAVVYDQLTSLIVPTIIALVVFGAIVAIGAWAADSLTSRRAVTTFLTSRE